MSKTLHIALRFDDPSPTSNHALERRIFDILEELDIPATVAVVPFGIGADGLIPLACDNASHLITAHANGIIEVAQHGFAHEPLSTTPQNSPSEFWGETAEEQIHRIDTGHAKLTEIFGQAARGFIPPWNTYDDNTVRQLAVRGYKYLSGSIATPPMKEHPLCLIPRTCDIHQLRQAYGEFRHHPFISSTIVVVMHHYDFVDRRDNPGNLSLQDFREALHWLKRQSGVIFITLQQLAENLGIDRSHAALKRHLKKKQLNWRLQRWLPNTLLMTHPIWMYLLPRAKV